MKILELSENKQFDLCLDLQRQIWGLQDIDVVPTDRLMMEMYLSNEDRKKNLHLNTDNMFEIEIPGNFQEIKKKNIDLARQLRERTRVLFRKMNDEHYVVTTFEYDKDQCTGKYVLMKRIV